VANLTYLAAVKLRHEGEDYQPGDDVSHFAPLIPRVHAHIEAGRINLLDAGGNEVLPRPNLRMNPELWGHLQADVAEAQAQPESDAGSDPGQGDDSAPLPDGDGEPAEGSDAPEGDADTGEAGDDAADAGEGDAEAAAFDPADHTINEVLAYLEDHPDDLEAVIAAEGQGKARSTLLAQLEAMATAPDDDE
jgi:hypothetical protein